MKIEVTMKQDALPLFVVVDDAELLAGPSMDIGGEILRRRAEALAARPGPRRPLSEELAEIREADLRLLRGER